MKNYKGKAIYNPSGKAGEYSYWACNFYVGCSNGCTYCYLKKGIGKATLGGDKPTLKKCFRDEHDAIEVFEKEVFANIDELKEHGLFFTFTSDPMLKDTIKLTEMAIDFCTDYGIPVKLLTKRADWLDYLIPRLSINYRHLYAFGFTLTGHDKLEPNASTNKERIEAMKKLYDAGFKTWASIEPIIDFPKALDMFHATYGICDLYKIGLKSGDKWKKWQVKLFIDWINVDCHDQSKVYFKDSLLKQAGIERSSLPPNCVSRDFNIFK